MTFLSVRGSNGPSTALVGIGLACTLAACGSASGGAPGGDPLATELSYLPAGSPVVAAITTDPTSAPVKSLSTLLSKFQVASLLTNSLKQQIQKHGVNYDTDVKPLLGNPARLRAFAAAPTAPAAGHGAIALNTDLSQTIKLTGGLVKSARAQLVLSELKQFSGWIEATPSALTGNLTLTVK